MRLRPAVGLLLLALAPAITGCDSFGGPGASATPESEIAGCADAVAAAAAVPDGRRDPADLDVALALCQSLAAFEAVGLVFPDALGGVDPEQLAIARCREQPALAGAPICRELDVAAVIPDVTPGPGQPEPGGIVFGTRFDVDRIAVRGERSTFNRSVPRMAWAAWLLVEPPPGKVEITVWRRSGNREHVAWREVVTLDDPDEARHGEQRNLARRLDREAGTYVMRYLVDGLPAAEGTFTLK